MQRGCLEACTGIEARGCGRISHDTIISKVALWEGNKNITGGRMCLAFTGNRTCTLHTLAFS
jgi:hypothetical protein